MNYFCHTRLWLRYSAETESQGGPFAFIFLRNTWIISRRISGSKFRILELPNLRIRELPFPALWLVETQLVTIGCAITVPRMHSYCSSDAELLFPGCGITVPRMCYFFPEMLRLEYKTFFWIFITNVHMYEENRRFSEEKSFWVHPPFNMGWCQKQCERVGGGTVY